MSAYEPRLTGLTGVQRILDERVHQLTIGYDLAHDEEHQRQELVRAAQEYISYGDWLTRHPDQPMTPQEWFAIPSDDAIPNLWPWRVEDFKPEATPQENYAKAGALLASEIDRLNHQDARREDA